MIHKEVSTPSNPSSGYRKLYFKSDGKLYQLNSSGTETLIGGALQSDVVTNNAADTVASATLEDLSNYSKSITTTGKKVLILFSGTVQNTGGPTAIVTFAILRDTTELMRVDANPSTSDQRIPITPVYLDNPSAGTYTYKMQWRSSVGTATLVPNTTQFSVMEI